MERGEEEEETLATGSGALRLSSALSTGPRDVGGRARRPTEARLHQPVMGRYRGACGLDNLIRDFGGHQRKEPIGELLFESGID